MFSKMIIQPSVTAFSSPILLVKNKYLTCIAFVDYRYLNSLTFQSKFPILVLDELTDELA
jgi:hypothetical protein